MTGGSAKANANFGPGLYEMEMIGLDENSKILHDWKVAGTMKEERTHLMRKSLRSDNPLPHIILEKFLGLFAISLQNKNSFILFKMELSPPPSKKNVITK